MPWIITTTLTVFAPLALVYFYVGRRIAASIILLTNWKANSVRRTVLSTALFINLYPLLFLAAFLIGGRTRIPAFSGESLLLDLFLTYPFWFGLVITVQIFLLYLLMDAVRIVVRFAAPEKIDSWKTMHSKAVLGAAVIVCLYSVVVIIKDTWTVRISERSMQVTKEAVNLAGKRIAVISDVQGDGRTDGDILEDYVRRVNELRPHMVLFAGDVVTSGEEYIESTARILGDIEAPLGKYAAVGDHDMFSNRDFVVREMRKAGFVIADDTTISACDGLVAISLVTQTYRQSPTEERLREIASESQSPFRIFLVHQPQEYLVQFAERQGYDLFAAGHTHGGGVAFGIPGIYTFAPANLESRYVSGFYELGKMLVVVTNGIGMTLAPIRFHAPSEITVINLVK